MSSGNREGKSGNPLGTVIDIIIIILVLAALVGIGFRIAALTQPTVGTSAGEYEVYFRLTGVNFLLPAYLAEGDAVYLSEDTTYFGTLLNESDSTEATPLNVSGATVLVQGDDGILHQITYPDSHLVDATGAVLASGMMAEDGGFLLGGTRRITPGEVIEVQTEKVNFTVTVTSISKH